MGDKLCLENLTTDESESEGLIPRVTRGLASSRINIMDNNSYKLANQIGFQNQLETEGQSGP